jgi:GNAT superfamily N-acetyltransferase
MDIQYDSTISEKDYNRLRRSVGWDEIPPRTAQAGLDNSEYLISAVCGGEPVGMARIVSDGGYVRYIADVVVHPDYQGCGIGREPQKGSLRLFSLATCFCTFTVPTDIF